MILKRAILSTVTIVMCATVAAAAPSVLRFGKIVDGTGRVIVDGIIIVDGERIVSVGVGTAVEVTVPMSEKVGILDPVVQVVGFA